MAAKRKKSKAKKQGSPAKERSQHRLTGPAVINGEAHFSPEDLQAYELAQYKVLNAKQAVQLKVHEIEEYQRKANFKLAQMQALLKQVQAYEKQYRDRLVELQAAITKKYGVDLSKITYDDETGRIMEPPVAVDQSVE